jgi:protein-tyrosine kinase
LEIGNLSEALNKSDGHKKRLGTEKASAEPVAVSTDMTVQSEKPAETAPSYDPGHDRPTNRFASNGRVDPLLVTFLEPQSQAAESFRLLGARIVSSNPDGQSRLIMVTSPQPLDGKSTVAANLAVVIAQELNKTAVLVDCDLRRPTLHQVFGLQANQGLHEYLAEGVSAEPYLIKTPMKNLSLIPGGRPSATPADLLSSTKMSLLMEELKRRFHYVIADFAPTGFSADTTVLSGIVDGVLLVARSRKTPKEMILEAVDRLGRDRILGVVFNEDSERNRRYQAYYKGYYKGERK